LSVVKTLKQLNSLLCMSTSISLIFLGNNIHLKTLNALLWICILGTEKLLRDT
jgi:hypothetical protein